jgi:hypothetical protein
MQERVRSSFIPRKEDVTEDYWEWLQWRCSQVRTNFMHTIAGRIGAHARVLHACFKV